MKDVMTLDQLIEELQNIRHKAQEGDYPVIHLLPGATTGVKGVFMVKGEDSGIMVALSPAVTRKNKEEE